MSASLHCYGALALETTAPLPQAQLERAAADTLAGHVATDLQRWLPKVDQLNLVLIGAHFDPAELLRPRWAVHTALAELGARAPGNVSGRVIAFGAQSGALPTATLMPERDLRGGPLRLLPFVLQGESDTVASVGQAMEERLLEVGMAGAATALYAQQAFGGRLEHARYLTLHDLCAITAMQYEHAGLAVLWPLIESALLAPDTEEWLDAAPEPLLYYRDGEVRMVQLDFAAWCETGLAPRDLAPEPLSRAFAAYRMRQRQFAAVLEAHAIPICEVAVGVGEDPRSTLRR